MTATFALGVFVIIAIAAVALLADWIGGTR